MNSYLFSGPGDLTIKATQFTEAYEKLKEKRPVTYGLFGCLKVTELVVPPPQPLGERKTNIRWKDKYKGSKRK